MSSLTSPSSSPLTFVLMAGTAALPHVLMRFFTTPSVRDARISAGWALFFIAILYLTAPAYAAFSRFVILKDVVGKPIDQLPLGLRSGQRRDSSRSLIRTGTE
ncbi:MAG: hypothetical protein Q9N34_06055 [Aquificota bacterium]|nr:hypothetical protein [Aquificota bacterium]